MPPLALAGPPRRGTHAALCAVLARHRAVPLADLVAVLDATDAELREPRLRAGCELATLERFTVLLERLGMEVPGLAEELTTVHMAALTRCVDTLPHHVAILAELAGGLRLGLCSNFSHAATARAVLAQCGLAEHLDGVVISEELGFRKPRPEIFGSVADALGVAPEETLHVGDRLGDDVAGAAAAGMRTAWLTRRVRDRDAERARHPDVVPDVEIADLRELPAHLERFVAR